MQMHVTLMMPHFVGVYMRCIAKALYAKSSGEKTLHQAGGTRKKGISMSLISVSQKNQTLNVLGKKKRVLGHSILITHLQING